MLSNHIERLIKEHRLLLEHAIEEVIAQYHEKQNTLAMMKTLALLNYENIEKLVFAAQQQAKLLHIAVVITIYDEHSEFVLSYRMPGSSCTDIASAGEKAANAVAHPMSQPQCAALIGHAMDLSPTPNPVDERGNADGAYPIYLADKLTGGLGISGGCREHNNQIAITALKGLNQGVNHE